MITTTKTINVTVKEKFSLTLTINNAPKAPNTKLISNFTIIHTLLNFLLIQFKI